MFSDKELKQVISEQVQRLNEDRKVILEQQLNEVKFKIDLLDHGSGQYKKFEKALKKLKTYFRKNKIDYSRGFGYSVSSTQTSSYRDGEGKQRMKNVARLKLDKFEDKISKCDLSVNQVKKDIEQILEDYKLEIIDTKYRENKPEEIIFTINL